MEMNFNNILDNEIINQVYNGIKDVYVDGKLCKIDEDLQNEILNLFFKLEKELDTEEEVTDAIVKYIEENHKDKINYEIVEVLRLQNEYEKADDKVVFLIENGFIDNVEKVGYKEEENKGKYSEGRTYRVDFKNRKIILIGFSTDD